ncbi:hypothetical protein PGB90_002230 [Kerria lacca]
MSSVKEEFTLPNNQPVVTLDCKTAFNALTNKEKLYAHYLSQACWIGSLIVLLQTSRESPLIFTLLHKIFCEESVEELKKKVETKLTEEEFKVILVYTCGLFSNAGNYKGFGDTKFVPNLPVEKFELVIKESNAYKNSPEYISSLWERCKDDMYSLNDNVKSLGFPGKGITTYFSSNYEPNDIEQVNELMKQHNIEGYNNRTIKIQSETDGTPRYQVLLASVEDGVVKTEKYGDKVFEILKGDYSFLLRSVNENLSKAQEYASTDTEKFMIDKYINSFQTGSLEEHKNGSRFWIKNKNPIIETYIGFIETYRDPHGSRGEFEGFVAMVNKEMSKKFAALVNNAEHLLLRLPWPNEFEKDKFQKPDFTSLDVLTFSGSGIPSGINIPNYDEIRQNEGFKNVSLGNVIPSSFKDSPLPFLSAEDRTLIIKYAVQAFEISSWYEPGETYDSIFTTLGSAYEECRAECVGLYLSLFPDVAHCQARFVITRILLEAGDELVKVTEPVLNDRLLISLNREKLQSVGATAIKNFLLKLQVYKTTANLAEAKKLFDKYSEVSDDGIHPWQRWRNIVLKHRQPRKLFVQSNTSVSEDDTVELKTYEPTLESLIKSWVERFPNNEFIHTSLIQLAEKDRIHFKY